MEEETPPVKDEPVAHPDSEHIQFIASEEADIHSHDSEQSVVHNVENSSIQSIENAEIHPHHEQIYQVTSDGQSLIIDTSAVTMAASSITSQTGIMSEAINSGSMVVGSENQAIQIGSQMFIIQSETQGSASDSSIGQQPLVLQTDIEDRSMPLAVPVSLQAMNVQHGENTLVVSEAHGHETLQEEGHGVESGTNLQQLQIQGMGTEVSAAIPEGLTLFFFFFSIVICKILGLVTRALNL